MSGQPIECAIFVWFNLYLTCSCVKQPADCLNGFRVIKSQIQRRARYWSVRDLDWNCVLTSIGVQACVCVLQKMINSSFSFFLFFKISITSVQSSEEIICKIQMFSAAGSWLADRSASHLQLRTKIYVTLTLNGVLKEEVHTSHRKHSNIVFVQEVLHIKWKVMTVSRPVPDSEV